MIRPVTAVVAVLLAGGLVTSLAACGASVAVPESAVTATGSTGSGAAVPAPTGANTKAAGPASPTATQSPGKIAAAVSPPVAGVGDSTQVITVAASGYGTSYATLTAWQKGADGWKRAYGPWAARIGANGFSTLGVGKRRQGTNTTPVGIFDIGQGFGLSANPGTAMPWIQVDGDDWWPYDPQDPRTYNLLQTSRPEAARWRVGGWSEHLASHEEYAYAFVVNFNLPTESRVSAGLRVTDTQADTRAGGGIFLHVDHAGPTAGCISVSRKDMVALSRWLRPDAHPLIAMGPASVLAKL